MRARRLQFSGEARADLREIRAYLTKAAGPLVSARMAGRLQAAIASRRETPRAGAACPDYRPTCRFIYERPYLIYYEYDGETMSVLRILHQARDRDSIMTAPPGS